jgi:hypothetical protein
MRSGASRSPSGRPPRVPTTYWSWRRRRPRTASRSPAGGPAPASAKAPRAGGRRRPAHRVEVRFGGRARGGADGRPRTSAGLRGVEVRPGLPGRDLRLSGLARRRHLDAPLAAHLGGRDLLDRNRDPPERRATLGGRLSAHHASLPPAESGSSTPGPLDDRGGGVPRMREIPGWGRELRAGPPAFPRQGRQRSAAVTQCRSTTLRRGGGHHMLGRSLTRAVPIAAPRHHGDGQPSLRARPRAEGPGLHPERARRESRSSSPTFWERAPSSCTRSSERSTAPERRKSPGWMPGWPTSRP